MGQMQWFSNIVIIFIISLFQSVMLKDLHMKEEYSKRDKSSYENNTSSAENISSSGDDADLVKKTLKSLEKELQENKRFSRHIELEKLPVSTLPKILSRYHVFTKNGETAHPNILALDKNTLGLKNILSYEQSEKKNFKRSKKFRTNMPEFEYKFESRRENRKGIKRKMMSKRKSLKALDDSSLVTGVDV